MNPLEGLGRYLDRLEGRLRLFAWTRGAAAIIVAALLLTLLIVGGLILLAFSPASLLAGRFILFLGVGVAIAAGLVVPLLRMNRRKAAQEVEHLHPGFDQRLLTFTERSKQNAADPFLSLIAEDALVIARDAEPEKIIAGGRLIRFGSLAAAAAGLLLWLVFWGPGVMGYGTSLLWGSYANSAAAKPFYSIAVQPGNKTIRRKSDQALTAQLSGFSASKASVWVQYASTSKWEEAPMAPQPGGAGFDFLFIGVQEDLQYYVEASGVKSGVFKLHAIDLPAVKNISVTFRYPAWTGMAPVTEDPGGDLRAAEGTVAKLVITTDKPLHDAQIVFEQGKPIDLVADGENRLTASVPIEKDGTYHIAVMDHGESVRLTDDYFIEARRPGDPKISITRPGKDARVSPIEEVPVAVTAESEYPLQELDLHYSVNGAAEKVIPLLKQKGAKQAEGSALFSLEDFKLVPGDIVSIYATARDGRSPAKTDMYFIQAVPFEFEYSQSQQEGGGGGAGGQQEQDQQLSEREKEIIAATFNQLKGDAKAKAAAAENGKYLAEVQAKLRDQAQSLANRMKARQLDGSGAAFSQFVKEMEAAVQFMSPAADKLKELAFQNALPAEQQALQHLLRAEATFRQIQVQISRGGGGGGGGGGAGRDLANLFDLELDKDKNQFETSASSAAEQKQQQIDETLKKLADLARRQQELAQQPQNAQQLAQQRYQQEMLRREAEELKRQMESLERGDSGQQSQQQGQQGQQQGQQSGQGGQSGQQSGQQSSQQSGQKNGQPGQAGQPQSAQNARQQGNQQNQPGQTQQGQTQQGQQQNPLQNGLARAQKEQLDRAIRDLEQAERDMSASASARQQGQQQAGQQGQTDAQRAAQRLNEASQQLESLRHQQTGSELGDIANKAEQLAARQQEFEQALRRNFGQGAADPRIATQMAEEKQKMLDSYNQIQKDMQQAARDVGGTQPNVAKDLRDAMGKSQQAEVGTRMEWTMEALRRGLGQYAIMREAPITQALNELKDQLKKLEAAAGNGAPGGQGGDDKSQIAMQQALSQAERLRREVEQLSQSQQQSKNGQQAGNHPGNGQRGQNGQQQSAQSGQQQAGKGQPGQPQGGGQQGGGQQGGGQQGGGQQGGQQSQQAGQQPGGQQAGMSPRGGSQSGGGNGTSYSPSGGAISGSPTPGFGEPGGQPANAEAAFGEIVRDLGRLRSSVSDDKDLSREIGDLQRRVQQLDPRNPGNDPRLSSVIGSQVLAEVDEVELLLRRKLDAKDGSVRSVNPRNTPTGYADAVAEYYKRLSKQ